MKKNIELLAPAGNKTAFIAAINAGADAVYLSGKNFGARKFANNFTEEEIAELITYAHLRNVSVFVTINTIIYEEELEELFKYSDFLVCHQVDALIVQDLGIINTFVKRYPNTEIHASTQMNVFNVHQAKYLKSIGVKRIILARETSIDTIKEIRKSVDIDLEVFVHGALCVAYSGNCLFSSMNGGRSGNRGECAQNCRMRYSLYKGNQLVNPSSYLLSTKDLMTIDHLQEIIDSGVVSLKIEGRMKSPEYVVTTVLAYKEAITSQQIDMLEKIKDLKKVFNRQYTKGYILNEQPYHINNNYRPNHLGIDIGKVIDYSYGKTTILLSDTLNLKDGIRILGDYDYGDQVNKIVVKGKVVSKAFKGETVIIDFPKKVKIGSKVIKTQDSVLLTKSIDYLNEHFKRTKLTGSITSKVSKPLELTLRNDFSESVTVVSDYIVEAAKKAGATKEKIYTQINKLGNTHYYLEDFQVFTDELGFIPNIVLNNLRREAIESLEHKIVNIKTSKIVKEKKIELNIESKKGIELICKVETLEQLKACKELNIDTIYQTENLKPNNNIQTNRIWYDKDLYKQANILIRDTGLLDLDSNITTDSTFNIANSKALEELVKLGVKNITLSHESSIYNSTKILNNFEKKHNKLPNITQIVYGKTDLMLSKYCPITKSYGVNKLNCNLCMQRDHFLKDESGNEFKIIRDGYCNIRILHSKYLNLITYLNDLKNIGVNTFRLDFTDEDYFETKEVVKAYLDKLNHQTYHLGNPDFTTGRFLK